MNLTTMLLLTTLLALIPTISSLHIGLICPGHAGHLNPTSTLGEALKKRGHKVTLISTPQPTAFAAAERHSLEFEPIGIPEYESGALQTDLTHEGRLRGLKAFCHTIRLFKREESLILRDLPSLLEKQGIDALCADQLLPAAIDVCEVYNIPSCVLCNALPLHLDASIPPFVTTWKPPTQDKKGFRNWLRRCRNRVANLGIVMVAAPLYLTINAYRNKNGLPRHGLSTAQQVGNVQLTQLPSFVDFERNSLPAHFYYSRPWHASSRDENIDFPWEQLDGRPILYVSLGTVQNRLQHLYSILTQACPDSHQLVMALGRKNAFLLDDYQDLPTNAIVVDYAPQTQLLPIADLVVTHAGMNTALEAIQCAKPMVCIPLCNDQPGVAARLKHHGTCELVPSGRATVKYVRRAIDKVLADPSYQCNSERLSNKIQNDCPTLEQTAELLEVGLSRSINDRLDCNDVVVKQILAKSMDDNIHVEDTADSLEPMLNVTMAVVSHF